MADLTPDTSSKDLPHVVIDMDQISARERYQLLTSLVVPRPIGWLSSRSAEGVPNLAPFSYYVALAASPMLVGISVGHRPDGPKDSLENIRHAGSFCVNAVTEGQLQAMNVSSGEYAPEVDEFECAGLPLAECEVVGAPFVANCPAVFSCRLFKEVDLGSAPNTLVIGEVVRVRLSPTLEMVEGRASVEPESLKPVGRLGGPFYSLLGELVRLDRP